MNHITEEDICRFKAACLAETIAFEQTDIYDQFERLFVNLEDALYYIELQRNGLNPALQEYIYKNNFSMCNSTDEDMTKPISDLSAFPDLDKRVKEHNAECGDENKKIEQLQNESMDYTFKFMENLNSKGELLPEHFGFLNNAVFSLFYIIKLYQYGFDDLASSVLARDHHELID
jgi:hypothetical protein